MKKLLVLLFSIIFLATFVNAGMSFFPNTGVINTQFDYVFNFTTVQDCTGVLISFQETILTNNNGIGFADVDISSLTEIPSFLCEFKDGNLRKTHNFSDIIFNHVYTKNLTANNITTKKINSTDWTNVTILENQISLITTGLRLVSGNIICARSS